MRPPAARRVRAPWDPADAPATRVPFVGLVSAVDVPGAAIVLAHDAISGYGPAGLLTVRVDDAEAMRRLAVGDRLRATMILMAGHDVVLEHAVVTPRDQIRPAPESRLGGKKARVAANRQGRSRTIDLTLRQLAAPAQRQERGILGPLSRHRS